MIWSGKRTIWTMVVILAIIGLVFTSFMAAPLQTQVADQTGGTLIAASKTLCEHNPNHKSCSSEPPSDGLFLEPTDYTWAG